MRRHQRGARRGVSCARGVIQEPRKNCWRKTFASVSEKHQFSRAPRTLHDGVLKHGGYARGGADAHEYRPQPAAVRNDARHTPRRMPTFRARRICFTSCQTARASAHRAVHLDGPGTKARACSWRHANAQALGDGTEQRVYTFGRRSCSQSIIPAGACFPRTRLFTISPANCQSGVTDKTLFAPGDANLNNTVSLRRSAMRDDG